MRRKRSKIVTGLDIGTTKIVAITAQMAPDDPDQNLTILGVGSTPSQGLKKGMVVDIDATVDSIRKAVHKAEEMSKIDVREVYVGIAGGHIESDNARGYIEVQNPSRGVTEGDRQRVLKRAQESIRAGEHLELIHSIPQEFLLDGHGGITNPVGMSCSRLEARVHLIFAAVTSASNILRCVTLAGLRPRDLMLESLASSLALLTDHEKEVGVILIDVGGGTSDVAVFADGAVRFSGVIPYGGDTITNDIAKCLKISRDHAENVKKKNANADSTRVDSDEKIELTSLLKSTPETASRRELCEIVEARLEEIFMMARKMIESSPVKYTSCAGVVLTGGTALMEDIDHLAERVFELPVKVGVPQNLKGMSSGVTSPIYSTGIGLVLSGYENDLGTTHINANGNIFHKVTDLFSRVLNWYS